MSALKPLEILSKQEVEMIDAASKQVLKDYGVRVEDPVLRDELQEIGCEIAGERVKIGEEIIHNSLKTIQNTLFLEKERGYSLDIKPGVTYNHPFGATAYVLDPITGKKREGTVEDQKNSIKIMNRLDSYKKLGAMIYPKDVNPEISQVMMTEALLRYSKKPLSSPGISTPEEAKYVVELFKAYGSKEKNIGSISLSPESPLFYPKTITDIMRIVIEQEIPVTALVCPIVGLTAPMTIAGGLVQMNASFLAFTVMAKLFNEKTPLIYGARLGFSNLKTGHSIYGIPEVGIAGACSVQLANYYGFISDVYGLSCNSCTYDNQAGYEKAINGFLPVLAGTNFVSGLGGLASSTIASLEQLVIDGETFDYLVRVVKNFEVNSDTLATQVIGEVAKKGNYLEQEHTIKYLRSGEVFLPKIGFANLWYDWEKEGRKEIKETALEKVMAIINSPDDFSPIPDEIEREVEKIIQSAKTELVKRKK